MSTAVEEHRPLGIGELPVPPEPVSHGPTWAMNPGWTPGMPTSEKYGLPELTLGWQIQAWIEGIPELGVPGHLNSLDDVDEWGQPLPMRMTDEQLRFILWMYAVDEHGKFVFRNIVLQRLKGWGKDPLASIITAVEFVGPSRFYGWAAQDYPEFGLRAGDPVGRRHQRSWIQIAAVAQSQTVNTMAFFPGLFTAETIKEHGIDLGKEVIYAHGGKCRIQAVTSNPRTLEGGRPTLVIKNETHHWLVNNGGHEMSEVIDRNLTKSKGGTARSLSITNAYNPGEDSVAQQERESWEEEVASGWKVSTMYDTLEAHKDALMYLPDVWTGTDEATGKKQFREPSEDEVREYVSAVVNAVRGDAWWLDVEAIVDRILKPAPGKENAVSTLRRFYYNQVLAAEDSWVHPEAVRRAVDPFVASLRKTKDTKVDKLRVGWAPVGPEEPIVMFFDGSKSRDSTALVGCRLSDGYTFLIGVWQQPRGDRGKKYLIPRGEVDHRVDEAHRRFTIVAFFADPSHAIDDEDDTRYWDSYIDGWHQRYHEQYVTWSVKTGDSQHSVMWDMTSPAHQEAFVKAAERTQGELEQKDDVEEYAPAFQICGHSALTNHLNNARAYDHPKGYGISIHKGSRTSKRKIDIAVCLIGARMLRRLVMNRKKEEEKQDDIGAIW
jgi:hypothetical protein